MNIYIVPLQDIIEALSVLAYMMLNVVTNEYITSVSKTMHSKLKEMDGCLYGLILFHE